MAATNKNGNDGNGNGNHGGGGGGGGAPQSSASSLSSLSDDEDTPPYTPMPSNPNIPVVPPVLPEDTPIPPASETLVAIIECFKQNLMAVTDLNDYHGKKTWLTWLINFVGKRMNSSVWNGFRWEGNLLRTRGLKPGQEQEKMFWLLRWEDKVSRKRRIESNQWHRELILQPFRIHRFTCSVNWSTSNSVALRSFVRRSLKVMICESS